MVLWIGNHPRIFEQLAATKCPVLQLNCLEFETKQYKEVVKLKEHTIQQEDNKVYHNNRPTYNT